MSTHNSHFRCPHCKRVQPKSEIDQMMSGAYFVSFGSPVVTCSSCNRSIERQEIIQGKHDVKKGCVGQGAEVVGGILMIGLLIWLVIWLFS